MPSLLSGTGPNRLPAHDWNSHIVGPATIAPVLSNRPGRTPHHHRGAFPPRPWQVPMSPSRYTRSGIYQGWANGQSQPVTTRYVFRHIACRRHCAVDHFQPRNAHSATWHTPPFQIYSLSVTLDIYHIIYMGCNNHYMYTPWTLGYQSRYHRAIRCEHAARLKERKVPAGVALPALSAWDSLPGRGSLRLASFAQHRLQKSGD